METRDVEIEEYIEKIIGLVQREDSFSLRDLSNKLIERAAIQEDPRLVNMSLISYALSKLMRKPHVSESAKWESFKENLVKDLTRVKEKPATKKAVEEVFGNVLVDITNFDASVGNFIIGIVEQARVKQASRVYALGLSLSRAAEITGANKQALLNYIGITKIHERNFTQSKPVEKRYRMSKKILGG